MDDGSSLLQLCYLGNKLLVVLQFSAIKVDVTPMDVTNVLFEYYDRCNIYDCCEVCTQLSSQAVTEARQVIAVGELALELDVTA
jgi:hypothetical protein